MSDFTEAIVLAGGLGTRLQRVVNDLPKAMAPVRERPFLEFLLDYLAGHGLTRVILSVGYKHEHILRYFGSAYREIALKYAVEEEPLGTGGGILKGLSMAETGQVLVANGDTMFRADLNSFWKFHVEKNAKISMALRKVDDVSRYGSVLADSSGRITGFVEKNAVLGEPAVKAGLINGGLYLIDREYFLNKGLPEKFSLEQDFFEKHYTSDLFFGYVTQGYFLDIGIPEDYSKAQHEFERFEH